jgi:hypothetical protein
LSAVRVVLGPFVIGGGMLLATIGGSVAVAATMITASTIATSDVPARHGQLPVSTGSSSRPAAGKPAGMPINKPGALASGKAGRPATLSSQRPATAPITPLPAPGWTGPPIARSAAAASSAAATSSPSPSGSGPAGNALIYVIGYNQATDRLVFQFADLRRGTGPGGSDLYLVSGPARYSAGIAQGISITSAGQLCPPAGSRCTVGQLIAAASDGFFASAAIDPAAQLDSITELDSASASAQADPSSGPPAAAPTIRPSPTSVFSTPSPSPTASPSG